jgi:hypothetical protein
MIERQIIIGLISSTEYCQSIKSIWNIRLLSSATAKLMAGWVWEYFEKYNKAPGKDIESIFYSKLKENKVQKSLAEEIEQDILPGLSDQYTSEEFNLSYLVEETEKYLNQQHVKLFTAGIESLLAEGRLEEVEKLVHDFKPLGIGSSDLNKFILSVDQIREKKNPQPPMLLHPWLRQGQTTIIYGSFGSGKSLLTILISYVIGMRIEDTNKFDISNWSVKNSTGCLYIDGELGEKEMEERISQFEWFGRQKGKYKIKILPLPEYQAETEDSFYLSERKNQVKIINWLRDNPDYKLIVLDSASTLFGLQEENNNSEWSNKINPFLRDLRALDVACILLHHSGKDNKRGLRGASAIGAMAHNIFRLTNTNDKEEGEASFTLTKDKQRAAGHLFKQFSLKFIQSDNKRDTNWEST